MVLFFLNTSAIGLQIFHKQRVPVLYLCTEMEKHGTSTNMQRRHMRNSVILVICSSPPVSTWFSHRGKYFGSSERHWKSVKKRPILCKIRSYRLLRYSSTCYGNVSTDPLMTNVRNPDFFASLFVNTVWFVVVRSCKLNRAFLNGPKVRSFSGPISSKLAACSGLCPLF